MPLNDVRWVKNPIM